MTHQFIKDRDIVFFSFQPWDAQIGSNFKDMAVELAKHNRVLFVNRALDRASMLKKNKTAEFKTRLEAVRYGKNEFQKVHENIWIQNPRTIVESINWIPDGAIYDYMNKLNNKRLAREINKAIGELGFEDVILINDNDFMRGRYLKQYVKCKEYIFYLRDYMLGVQYFRRHGPKLEAETMKAADLVVANSAYLAGYAKKFNSKSFDIGQGCELEKYLINEAPIPEDIKSIAKPIIGYMGYISAWRLNADIVIYLAEKLPHCSIVLVGPADNLFETANIKHLSNLHLMGSRPVDVLSHYIYYFDVCINPQLLNEITIGNYPRKVDEYLAMGKPVVATETEAMQEFKPYTYLCKTKEEWVSTIERILRDPEKSMSPQEVNRRKSFALSHTWSNSIGRLGDAYYQTIKNAS